MYLLLHENIFSFLWGMCPRVQLLGHMVVASLVFKETTKMFSQRLYRFTFPRSSILNFDTWQRGSWSQ